MGVVARQTTNNSANLCNAGKYFILVWIEVFICWFGRGLGFKAAGFWTLLLNFSNTNLCFLARKHVYAKNSFLCVLICLHCYDSGVLEVKR